MFPFSLSSLFRLKMNAPENSSDSATAEPTETLYLIIVDIIMYIMFI